MSPVRRAAGGACGDCGAHGCGHSCGVIRHLATLGLALGLLPAVASASAPCPAWRERQTIDCMRGYLRVDPAAFVLAANRPGAAIGASVGVFRAFDGFALAFGARAGHDAINRQAFGFDRTLHVGPELRLGGYNPQAFGYMLMRAGYSHRFDAGRARFDFGGPADAYHYGLGVGVWGRLGKKFLLGAEGALDIVQFKGKGAAETLFLSLTLGSWL